MTEDLDTLVEVLALKALDRTGWVRRGVPRPESVAAHSWGVAWLVLNLLPRELSLERALSYAVLHDLPEVRVGDLTPHDGVAKADKQRLEAEALEGLAAGLPRGSRLLETWHRYEAQEDDEARFVRQLDRLDMALQALAYQRAGAEGMQEFVASARRVITHPGLVPILDRIEAALEAR